MNNLWFGLLLGTSTLFIGFNGAWFGIIDTMINLFSSEVEKVVDIRETVDDIRDTNFDYFDEKVESELMFGIELSEYDSVVNSLAINLGLPDTVKDTLLSAKNQLYIRSNGKFIFKPCVILIKNFNLSDNCETNIYHGTCA